MLKHNIYIETLWKTLKVSYLSEWVQKKKKTQAEILHLSHI